MQTLIVHGRQSEIARAELESLYGADKLRPAGDVASLLDIEPQEIDFTRLGGMVKFCKVLTTLNTIKWADIEKFLVETSPQHFAALPDGKLKIGLSVYGLKTDIRAIHATVLKLKKAGKSVGRSIRFIPNKELALNAAQVLHNKLTQKLGWELVFVRDGGKTIVAQSIAVQDIEKYAKRDHGRPCRDPKVGMLPPKLAQTIVNLSVGNEEPKLGGCILDPFCGTGVIMQEATLMHYDVYGSDIALKMIECTHKNMRWLHEKGYITAETDKTGGYWQYYKLEQGDATSKVWLDFFNHIASETYLGKPLSTLPDGQILSQIIDECDDILQKFLKNVASQTKPGFRMCLAVPAWKISGGFKHLETLDSLEELGYNRLKFEHVADKDLIYHRPGQVVARELLVLTRK